MPQQQKNSGIKTQRANLSYRLCYVPTEERRLLDYNIFTNRRYYRTVLAIREDIDNLPTNAVRQVYGVTQGINPDLGLIALFKLLLALNIVLSRLGDPAYLEYQGLSSIMYKLLIEAILTLSAAKEYRAILRSFPFLPSQLRVQGLLYYLKSYSLSKYARWSIVIPSLLRCQLQPKHICQHFLLVLRGNGIQDLIGYIVLQFVVAVRSNSVLISTTVSKIDRSNIYLIVQGYRTNLQQMLQALAQSINADKRRLSRPISRLGTLAVYRPTAAIEPSLAKLLISSRKTTLTSQDPLVGRQQSIK